ncbi:hypothetical protein [Symmachiella macrocystis]|nr:hypothetical protein [Symmachiella macrocystis]
MSQNELIAIFKRAGYAGIVAVLAYLVNAFGLPVDPESLNVVGSVSDDVVTSVADKATAKTAISLPVLLFVLDIGVQFFKNWLAKRK